MHPHLHQIPRDFSCLRLAESQGHDKHVEPRSFPSGDTGLCPDTCSFIESHIEKESFATVAFHCERSGFWSLLGQIRRMVCAPDRLLFVGAVPQKQPVTYLVRCLPADATLLACSTPLGSLHRVSLPTRCFRDTSVLIKKQIVSAMVCRLTESMLIAWYVAQRAVRLGAVELGCRNKVHKLHGNASGFLARRRQKGAIAYMYLSGMSV